jgi:hypothetical protein
MNPFLFPFFPREKKAPKVLDLPFFFWGEDAEGG